MRDIIALKNLAFTFAYRNLRSHLSEIRSLAFVLAGIFGIVAFGAPAEADFFSELFGGGDAGTGHRLEVPPAHLHSRKGRVVQQERRDYSNARPGEDALRRHGRVKTQLSYLPARTRQRPHIHVSADANGDGVSGATKSAHVELCYANAPRNKDIDQSDAIMHDPTLRPGDSMMTPQGVRIFHGHRSCPHQSSEFLSLAEARDLSTAKRGALAAIELAMKASHGRDLKSAVGRLDKPSATHQQ